MVHDELTDATEHASFDHINDVWVVSTCTYAVVADVYFVRRCWRVKVSHWQYVGRTVCIHNSIAIIIIIVIIKTYYGTPKLVLQSASQLHKLKIKKKHKIHKNMKSLWW